MKIWIKDCVKKFVRKITVWAWDDFLFDVSRVEWKFGRYDSGKPKKWTEWENVREHLKETNHLRQPQELQ